jgi:uncharacterized protein
VYAGPWKKDLIRHPVIPALCLCLVLVHGGLASHPTKLSLLSATPPAQGAKDCPRGPRYTIGVSPARLPKYLDRPQIMTRKGPNELRLSEVDEWAEPLGENLSRVVAQDLKTLVCGRVVSLAGAGPGDADYRVAIDVITFDGTPGGEVTLDAQWTVYGRSGGTPLFFREEKLRQKVHGRSYDDLVTASSALAASLSREIAGFFRSVSPAGGAPAVGTAPGDQPPAP